MEVTAKGRVLTFDLEAIGLLDDIRAGHREDLHIIRLKDIMTKEVFTFFDEFDQRRNAVWLDDFEEGYKHGNILEGIKWMEECSVLISHNISGFDSMAIEKAVGFKRSHFGLSGHPVFPWKTCDTLVMSYLLNPERRVPFKAYELGLTKIGAHGIAAYGVLMGRYKPEHEDWSHLSKEMINRVSEDVEIGEWTFEYLMKEWDEQLRRPNKVTGKSISEAYYCELRMAFTVARQAQRGFRIDCGYIDELTRELDQKIDSTEVAFRPHIPKRIKMKKITDDQLQGLVNNMVKAGIPEVDISMYENYMMNGDCRASYAMTNYSITTKKGEYSKNVTKYVPAARGFMQDHANPPVVGPITPLVWEEIPLGNRDEVKQILYKYGWRGVTYNDAELEYIEENGELPCLWAGKIDDVSLLKWEESEQDVPEWCKGIAAWYILVSRRTQLCNAKDEQVFRSNGCWPRQSNGKNECRGILPKARCFDDSIWEGRTAQDYFEVNLSWPTDGHWRVPAVAFHCGTNTFRMRHKVVVNIPSRGLYGKEMRRCFISAPGTKLLGCDGSGLELRMLAHFMNDAMYTSIVLDGDIHTYNQEMAGLPDRDKAKKYIYMFLYGSGIPNLARQLNMTDAAMSVCVDKFKRNLPKLDQLITRVQDTAKNYGYLIGLDGRWGRVRTKQNKVALNTALNVLLQMAGSLVMKWAHIYAEDMAAEAGLCSIENFPIVAHVHDEMQSEVMESEIETMCYKVNKEDWKSEEKRQHIDEQGRIWSAPYDPGNDDPDSTVLFIERQYHPIGDIYCKALVKAGIELGLRCPTAGEYKIGDSWEDTH